LRDARELEWNSRFATIIARCLIYYRRIKWVIGLSCPCHDTPTSHWRVSKNYPKSPHITVRFSGERAEAQKQTIFIVYPCYIHDVHIAVGVNDHDWLVQVQNYQQDVSYRFVLPRCLR